MTKFLDVSGAESKIAWASEVLERSLRNYDIWSKSNLVVTSLIDPDKIFQKWVLHVKSLPPSDVILGFGDTLSNARSALDYLAWQIFVASGGDPSSKEARYIYFPIASDSVDFNKQRKSKLKGAWSEAVELARSLQDYAVGIPHYRALQGLESLCNSQKHRALHFAAVSPEFETSYQKGHWPVVDGELLVLDYTALENVPLYPNVTLTLARYWIQDEEDKLNESPLPRQTGVNYPSIEPPTRYVSITDGEQWIHVHQLAELVMRVRDIVSEFARLPIP